ncbi:MAG: cytochrome c oxidase subunit 3 [Flavobacteriales bacterium]|nr:cytochrome c oxidase subunit 3 [Flavobacteriales bacterium]
MLLAESQKIGNNEYGVQPRKFSLWLLIMSMCMFFAGLTSVIIVRMSEGNWFKFDLPSEFVWSTLAVVLSSLTMILAYKSAKKDNLLATQIFLGLTLMLGLTFVFLQINGFETLNSHGIFFAPKKGSQGGMISGSFVFLLVAAHLAHLAGGIIFILVVFVKSFLYKVHKKNTLSISMCNTYWHFVGILWLYLYMFLYLAPKLLL